MRLPYVVTSFFLVNDIIKYHLPLSCIHQFFCCGNFGSGVHGIDIDDKNTIDKIPIDLEDFAKQNYWVEETKRGYHIIARTTAQIPSWEKNDTLEYLGDKRLCIVSPSPNKKWIGVNSLLELPDLRIDNGLYDKYKEWIKGNIETRHKKNIEEIKRGVTEGERNNSAFKLACQCRDEKKAEYETIEYLKVWNKNNIELTHPFTDDEIIITVKSAYKYPVHDINEYNKYEQLENYDVLQKNEDGKYNGKIHSKHLANLLKEGDGRVYRVVKNSGNLGSIFIFNGSYYEEIGEQTIRQRIEYYVDKPSINLKREVISHIQDSTELQVERDKFGTDAGYLNMKNGVLELKTRTLLSHGPNFYFLNQLPVTYDSLAKAIKCLDFFNGILDDKQVTLLQEIFGDTLQSTYKHKKSFFFVGESNTGKSQVVKILELLLGNPNLSHETLYQLCHDKFSPIELYGKMLNSFADIDEGEKIKFAGIFKVLTGGDAITGQKKFGQRFSFTNTAKLLFSCNKPPEFDEKSPAVYNRVLLIIFKEVIPDDERIPDYAQTIVDEQELSGLLNWALDGYDRLEKQRQYSEHLGIDDVRDIMESNPISEFVKKYVKKTIDPNASYKKSDLYLCYVAFCQENGYQSKTDAWFSRLVKQHLPYISMKSEGQKRIEGRVWYGINCDYPLNQSSHNKKIDEYKIVGGDT